MARIRFVYMLGKIDLCVAAKVCSLRYDGFYIRALFGSGGGHARKATQRIRMKVELSGARYVTGAKKPSAAYVARHRAQNAHVAGALQTGSWRA